MDEGIGGGRDGSGERCREGGRKKERDKRDHPCKLSKGHNLKLQEWLHFTQSHKDTSCSVKPGELSSVTGVDGS